MSKWEICDSIHYKYFKIREQKFTNKIKAACFDLDHTIIKPIKNRFPKYENDWTYVFDNIKAKLLNLSKDHVIVIFSNQNRFMKSGRLEMIKKRIDLFLNDLDIPIYVHLSVGNDNYRKPNVGMFRFFQKQFKSSYNLNIDFNIDLNIDFNIDLSNSFYVGDAAGRNDNWKPNTKKDFSCADRKFAHNINLDFYTPEEFFKSTNKCLDYKIESYKYLENNNKQIKTVYKSDKDKQYDKILIICVGLPGTGKSTFCKKNYANYTCINQDILKTRKRCVNECDKNINLGKNIIIDSTNPGAELRKEYIELGKNNKYYIVCLYFDIDVNLAKHINNYRMKITGNPKVPEIAYNMYKSKFKLPSETEGFDEIQYVDFIPEFENNSFKEEFYLFS